MTPEQARKVERLQENLYSIRQLAGWKAEKLAADLDVTKQTIYNLERGKPKMSLVQYLAIRTLIDDEIAQQPDNEVLRNTVTVLVDYDGLPDEKYDELQRSLKTITTGMSRTRDRSNALSLVAQTVGAATAGLAVGLLSKSPIAGVTTWLSVIKAAGKLNDETRDD